jgi:hypothetical protein
MPALLNTDSVEGNADTHKPAPVLPHLIPIRAENGIVSVFTPHRITKKTFMDNIPIVMGWSLFDRA